jgi:hypothetical protein
MELIDFKEIGVSKQEAYGSTEVYRWKGLRGTSRRREKWEGNILINSDSILWSPSRIAQQTLISSNWILHRHFYFPSFLHINNTWAFHLMAQNPSRPWTTSLSYQRKIKLAIKLNLCNIITYILLCITLWKSRIPVG